MTPTPIWQSPTFWGAIAAGLVMAQQVFGYAALANEQSLITQLLGQGANIAASIIGLAGAVIALWHGIKQNTALNTMRVTLRRAS